MILSRSLCAVYYVWLCFVGFGGGTNVTNNLIYNQCRESGDHGAMNSW
jgi:hypothetical protein|eukprot:COSAG06_NODE_7171_length_2599_cov_1.955200_3_plen_48_part_00